MNRTIYCISGLGTDEKIFCNLRINNFKLVHIPWISPSKDDTIQSYAMRLAESIKEDNAILLGVSFGGMLGIEIARCRSLQKLILVSSIKSSREMPRWMKVAGKLRLNQILPTRSFTFIERIDNKRLGITTPEEIELARSYRQTADKWYLEWGIHEILNWKNNWIPDNIIHIHGEHDKIFPIGKIKATHIVKGATHMMIYNRAEDVSNYLNEILT
jgi:pimeloyl-ACP methyl ester carboxylesterase